jgi:hypothetical protein
VGADDGAERTASPGHGQPAVSDPGTQGLAERGRSVAEESIPKEPSTAPRWGTTR